MDPIASYVLLVSQESATAEVGKGIFHLYYCFHRVSPTKAKILNYKHSSQS